MTDEIGALLSYAQRLDRDASPIGPTLWPPAKSSIAGSARAASPQGITGVAPGVAFRAYRVFGCAVPVGSGVSTNTDVLLSAIEAAGHANVNIVNKIIGAAYQWPQYPTGQASNRLVRMGITVVASIGNEGGPAPTPPPRRV